eukprot:5800410-Pyramimonas_sp.AAC.1
MRWLEDALPKSASCPCSAEEEEQEEETRSQQKRMEVTARDQGQVGALGPSHNFTAAPSRRMCATAVGFPRSEFVDL